MKLPSGGPALLSTYTTLLGSPSASAELATNSAVSRARQQRNGVSLARNSKCAVILGLLEAFEGSIDWHWGYARGYSGVTVLERDGVRDPLRDARDVACVAG